MADMNAGNSCGDCHCRTRTFGTDDQANRVHCQCEPIINDQCKEDANEL